MLMYFFAGSFFLYRDSVMAKLRVLVLCFSNFTDNSNILDSKRRRME